MSGFIKKQYDIDQNTSLALQISGPSLALGTQTGKDKVSETVLVQAGTTNAFAVNITDTVSETNMVTVV